MKLAIIHHQLLNQVAVLAKLDIIVLVQVIKLNVAEQLIKMKQLNHLVKIVVQMDITYLITILLVTFAKLETCVQVELKPNVVLENIHQLAQALVLIAQLENTPLLAHRHVQIVMLELIPLPVQALVLIVPLDNIHQLEQVVVVHVAQEITQQKALVLAQLVLLENTQQQLVQQHVQHVLKDIIAPEEQIKQVVVMENT